MVLHRITGPCDDTGASQFRGVSLPGCDCYGPSNGMSSRVALCSPRGSARSVPPRPVAALKAWRYRGTSRMRRRPQRDIVLACRAVSLRRRRVDHLDQPGRHDGSGGNRLGHQDEHVERVAVLALGGRDEPGVEGKAHPFGEDHPRRERFRFWIERELRANRFGCIDDPLMSDSSSRGSSRLRAGARVERAIDPYPKAISEPHEGHPSARIERDHRSFALR